MKSVQLLNNSQIIDTDHEEYYNLVRTNIQFSGDDIRSFVFTSADQGEGKSTVCLNTAISFAKLGKRVVLIDADIRRSQIYSRFQFGDNADGLTSFLSGVSKLEEVVYTTDVNGLLIIPSGKSSPNPAALLQSKRFEQLIEKLKKSCDYVLIDSPPIGLVADGLLIASKCDGSVLVAESGTVHRKAIVKMAESLRGIGTAFLGIILNKYKRSGYGRYGSYGKYGRYGNYGNYGNYGK